jgi:hypothetical protein
LGLEIVFKFPGIKKSKDVEYSAFGALAQSWGLSSPLASISNPLVPLMLKVLFLNFQD